MTTTRSTSTLRTPRIVGALAIGLALTATACGDSAGSQQVPTPGTSGTAPSGGTSEVGERAGIAMLDPSLEDSEAIPGLVLSGSTRRDAVTGIRAALADGSGVRPGIVASVQQLDLDRDVGVLRIVPGCGTEALPMELTADGGRLIDRYQHEEVMCEAHTVAVELWTVPRDVLADDFSIGEAAAMEPGDVRADGDTLVTPDVFTYAAFENEPGDLSLDAGDEPVVSVTQEDDDVTVVVESGGDCTVPRAALLGRRLSLWHPGGECTEDHVPRRTEILVPLDQLGDEVVVGLGEAPNEADQGDRPHLSPDVG